uniref:Uncharacterized protein n=1 Tax=Leersia perrieri TaxID=77586 RepID=A0A0D9VFN3_9ORYZ
MGASRSGTGSPHHRRLDCSLGPATARRPRWIGCTGLSVLDRQRLLRAARRRGAEGEGRRREKCSSQQEILTERRDH